MQSDASKCGQRGCCGKTKRRGVERYCAQPWTRFVRGKRWCYYHDPDAPKKFGEGCGDMARKGPEVSDAE